MNTSDNSTVWTTANVSASDSYDVPPDLYFAVVKTFAWLVLPLFMLAVFGNTLVVIVMNKRKNKSLTCSAYFSALAISDTLLLTQVSLERWFIEVLEINLYQYIPSSLGLRLRIIAIYANVHLSSWLLAIISVDRLISVLIPHKSKFICNLVTARFTICLTCAIVIGLNTAAVFALVNITFIPDYGVKFDDNVPGGSVGYLMFDMIFGFLCPFTTIMSCSVGILIQLRKSMAMKSNSRSSRNTSATVNLLSANAAFLITVSPFQIVAFFSIFTELSNAYTLFLVTLFLSDCNAALNFYVYILSGSRFRGDVKSLFFKTPLQQENTLK